MWSGCTAMTVLHLCGKGEGMIALDDKDDDDSVVLE